MKHFRPGNTRVLDGLDNYRMPSVHGTLHVTTAASPRLAAEFQLQVTFLRI